MNYPKDTWRDRDTSIFDLFSLKGKNAMVTGGGGGIGRNSAAVFAEAGANIALVDIPSSKDRLEPLAKELSDKYGVKVVPLYCDVSDKAQVDALNDSIVKEFGTLNIAHINAGVCLSGDDKDIPYETWKKTLGINLDGAFMTAQLAQKLMRKNNNGGSIIFTSSISGYVTNQIGNHPTPVLAYSTTKAAVSQYARALAAFVVKDGIRVNTIAPGYVWSGIHEGVMGQEGHDMICSLIPMERFGRNDELQGPLLFLASDASSYITGVNIPIDGGYMLY